jgi:hypothetical protein
LKTSLRKILYCAFKRRLTTEIKVAQFSGYVSENSAYHHGEAILNGAIGAEVQSRFNSEVARIGTAASALPYDQRQALIAQIESQLP